MKTSIVLALSLVSFVATAHAGYYDEANLAKLQKRYSKAVADPVPWSGYWFPYAKNGIAKRDRWTGDPSPAEKLDEVFGYQNVVTGWELANHGPANSAAEWWGHCNGWATASLLEREPRKVKTVNGVKFNPGEIKAILAEYWLEQGNDVIGTREDDPNDFSSFAFWDVVPAQFYLLLTNLTGRQHRSVIFDRFTGSEVWNQPLVAYDTKPVRPDDYEGPDPQYPNVYRVHMTTTIWWASDEILAEDLMTPFNWEENEFFVKRELRYELWLDGPIEFNSKGEMTRSGDVIVTQNGYGGIWENGVNPATLINTHPDFMWVPTSYTPSTGYKNPYINDDWVKKNLSR